MFTKKINASWNPSASAWVVESRDYLSWLGKMLTDVVLMVMVGSQIYRVLARSGLMADGIVSQAGFAVIECANAWVMVRIRTDEL